MRRLFSNLASNRSGNLEKSVNFQNPQTLAAARTAGCCEWALARKSANAFLLLSSSSSKRAQKAQKTQSYQRFQHIVHTAFNTSGTNGLRSLSQAKAGTHSALLKESHTAAHRAKQGRCSRRCLEYFAPRYIWVDLPTCRFGWMAQRPLQNRVYSATIF